MSHRTRKQHALLGGYSKRWDLSDLPHYVPKTQVKGTLQIWGSNYLKDGPLGGYWAAALKKFQPGITIEYNVPTAGIAVPALAAKVADLGFGRPATLMDYLTFQQVFHYSPTEIVAATGSYDVYGWSPAFIILVNKANPLTQISVKQLDDAFGSARLGGYQGSVWRSDYPYRRGPGENIRTCGKTASLENGQTSPFTPAVSRLAPISRPFFPKRSCAAAISGSRDIALMPITRRPRARLPRGVCRSGRRCSLIRYRCASPLR